MTARSECQTWHDSESPRPAPAVAVIALPGLRGITITYCRRHLDEYLDIADDNPHMEPASLEWLTVA